MRVNLKANSLGINQSKDMILDFTSPNNTGLYSYNYSTSQFSGAFFGGAFAGMVLQYGDYQWVFLSLAALAVIWIIAIHGMTSVHD